MAFAEHVERAVSAKIVPVLSGPGTFGGGFAAFFVGALNNQALIALGGLVVAALGLIVNFWHKRAMQRLARERLDLDKRLARQQFERESEQ